MTLATYELAIPSSYWSRVCEDCASQLKDTRSIIPDLISHVATTHIHDCRSPLRAATIATNSFPWIPPSCRFNKVGSQVTTSKFFTQITIVHAKWKRLGATNF